MGSPHVGRLFMYAAVVITGVLFSVTGAVDHVPGLADLTESLRPKAPTTAAIPDDSEEQLLMIYFGASTCGWCARPDTHELLRRAAFALRETAEGDNLGFLAIGVALDRDMEAGLDHLRLIGIFNQVSAGYSWANVGAI